MLSKRRIEKNGTLKYHRFSHGEIIRNGQDEGSTQQFDDSTRDDGAARAICGHWRD